MGRLLLLCLALLAGSCAGTDRVIQADGRWPGEKDPGSQYVQASVFDDRATVTFEMMPAMAFQDGTLVRSYVMAVEPTESAAHCFWDIGVVLMDAAESFGGGVGSLYVSASPRAGLTWREVGDEEDVVITVGRSPVESGGG